MATQSFKETSLAAAVKAESDNWKSVGGLYGQAARELSELFTSKGNPSVHMYMCAAQDQTGDPLVWNRAMTGLKKALSALPTPVQFTATRDFRPTHRAKNPLFELATKASVDAGKAEAARANEEKARAIEADAAAAAAAEKAEAESKVTEADIAASVIATCERLGLDIQAVITLLTPTAAPITEKKTAQKKAA